jgi:hypothetical protein
MLAAVAAVLLFELAPMPRTLYSARVPDIYQAIANDTRDVRVLELPWGIRDGTSSIGNFSAASQFYQAFHHKQLYGGYISRVSRSEIRRQRTSRVLRKLIWMSEGRKFPYSRPDLVRARGRAFTQRTNLGYIVIDRQRCSDELKEFAIQAFDLVKIGESPGRELYIPRPEFSASHFGS